MSAEMDAVVHNLAEMQSVGIEDGDVLADLRGSRGAVTMEGYDRYTCGRDFIERAAFPLCPAGTVGDPVPSHLLLQQRGPKLVRGGICFDHIRALGIQESGNRGRDQSFLQRFECFNLRVYGIVPIGFRVFS